VAESGGGPVPATDSTPTSPTPLPTAAVPPDQRAILEAELEAALSLARAQLSLIRGSLATAATFLTRPER
jgi:hypothetical protein